MQKHKVIDAVDLRILKLMMSDARVPYAEVARQCGISGATVQQRIKAMHDNGVVKGMRLVVDPDSINSMVCAFVNIKIIQPNMMDTVIDAMSSMREVVECHTIIGEFTLLAKIYCRSNVHLMEFVINHILKIPGVAGTSSNISLKQQIDHPIPVFDDDDDQCFCAAI
jgi:Lrp/AsnC family transcriptional regulator for asnA, asnC and gidA